jgi:kynureninase
MALTRSDCEAFDARDVLAHTRARFVLPDGVIYLDGNSLGALPKGVAKRVADAVVSEWGEGLIRSWNAAGWWESPARMAVKLAPMLGAGAHQVTVCDAISINLFKVVVAAARLNPGRKVVLAEAGNFPSDNYIVESAARLLGLTVRYVPASEIAAAIDGDTAVVELSHVNYKSAEIVDMAAVTAAAHARGALIIWDLAHSTGAVELHLDRDRADFAVGCGYKFLNGGPGAPAHIYVAERHLGQIDQPLAGWWGHATPFAFGAEYVRAPGIEAMLCSTAPILNGVAFEAALEAFDGVAMRDVQAKGRALGCLMVQLVDEQLGRFGVGLAVPRDGARRGNHVSVTHPEGYRIMQALIARGVIGDFRAPDIMRFGFGPLYVRYADIWDAVAVLAECLRDGSWRSYPAAQTGGVT